MSGLELEPEQPEPVVRAIEEVVRDEPAEPDPWWQAGIDEASGSGLDA